MKSSKKLKVCLIVVVALLAVMIVADKAYDSKFDAHQSRNAVFEYNGYDYKRLDWLDGYYIWDNINSEIGNIRPPFIDVLLGDEWYMYDFENDSQQLFLSVKTKNQWGYFHNCYREDVALPEISSENIKSLEIIPGVEDDKYEVGGLFNNDFTMNNVKSAFSLTDKTLIEKIVSYCEEETKAEFSCDDFGVELSEYAEYYVIATFKNVPESLCYIVGIMDRAENKVTIEYTRTPFGSDSVFYW